MNSDLDAGAASADAAAADADAADAASADAAAADADAAGAFSAGADAGAASAELLLRFFTVAPVSCICDKSCALRCSLAQAGGARSKSKESLTR